MGDFGAGWSQGMWRLCLEDDQQNRTVVNLVRQSYTIGRAEDNAIRLTERNISRAHAVLERSGEQWLLKDLDSYTGCFVNDKRVDKEQVIDHGDRLRLGDYAITLTDEARQDETVKAVPSEAPAESGFSPERHDRLVVIEGPNVGASYPLTQPRMLIGRGEECDIALNDTSVSRVHADIERIDDGQYRITDQNSSNGVRINGIEAPSITLDIGDVVELGDVFLKFVPRGISFDPTLSTAPSAAPPAEPEDWLHRLTSTPRLLAYVAAGGLALGLLIFGLSGSDAEQAHEPHDPSTLAMAEATALFKQGKLQAAHDKLKSVSATSAVKNSDAFRRIEASWADSLFEQAETSGSEEEERRLLSLVAAAENVDSLRRRKAAEWLQQLNAANMGLNDLPPAAESDAGDADFKIIDEEDDGASSPNDTAPDDGAAVEDKPPAVKQPRPKLSPKPQPKPIAPKPVAPKPPATQPPATQPPSTQPTPEPAPEATPAPKPPAPQPSAVQPIKDPFSEQ